MSCEACFRQHKHAWDAAVQHPFLKSCQQGSINQCQFDTWLVQDYLFVKEFTRLAANLLTVAPYCDYEGLLGGLGALRDELKWFQEQAVKRGITLTAEMQQTNIHFCDYMRAVAKQPYAVQAVVFWSIEQAYCQAWRNAMPTAEPYKEFADRWGSDSFHQYCQLLERQADAALQHASEEEKHTAADACGKVAEHEQAFWQMAFEG